MKKFFLIFFLIMFFLCIKLVSAKDYIDLKPYYQYKDSIVKLVEENIMTGYSDGTIRPNDLINRAEFLKIVMLKNEIKPSGENCFVDVKNEWFGQYICKAKETGIISGYSDGTFKPEQNVSVVEASKILIEAKNILIFDRFEYNLWFEPYITKMSEERALPYSLTKFDHLITRGEAAEMIKRLYGDFDNYESLNFESLEIMSNSSPEIAFKYKYGITEMPTDIDYASFYRIKNGGLAYTNEVFYTEDAEIYRDDNYIYCYKRDNDVGILERLPEVDAETFKMWDTKSGRYISDKNYIYEEYDRCLKKEIKLDPSIKNFYRDIFKDEKNIYLYQYDILTDKGDLVKYEDISSSDFEHFNLKLNGNDSDFFHDKKSIYVRLYEGIKKLDFDKATFKLVNDEHWILFKDKNGVYVSISSALDNYIKLDDIDKNSLKVLVSNEIYILFKDKKNLYSIYGDHNIVKTDKIDLHNLEIVRVLDSYEEPIFIKDTHHVYSLPKLETLTFANPDDFEYEVLKRYGWSGKLYPHYISTNSSIWVLSFKSGKYTGEYKELTFADPDDFIYEDLWVGDYNENVGFHYIKVNGYIWFPDFATGEYIKMDMIDEKSFEYLAVFSENFAQYDEQTGKPLKERHLFIMADKNYLYLFDFETGELKKLRTSIDFSSFSGIFGGPFFKDKKAVYFISSKEFFVIEEADPDTFDFKYPEDYNLPYYFEDKNFKWIYDEASNSYKRVSKSD